MQNEIINLKFPSFNQSLPPSKNLGTNAYLAFIAWQLKQMGAAERKRQVDQRPIPVGDRFTLSP